MCDPLGDSLFAPSAIDYGTLTVFKVNIRFYRFYNCLFKIDSFRLYDHIVLVK